VDRPHAHGAPESHDPLDLHVPASIHPELAAHSDLYLPPKVHRIGERVHCAVGWNLANITMIEGDDGIVIVDTGMNVQQGSDVLAELRRITEKPIAAIVLTHHHIDHVQGTSSFVDPARARAGAMPIYAHESLMDEYSQENVLIGPIMNARAIPMYNLALSGDDAEGMNAGIGPVFGTGQNGFIQPTHTFGHDLEVTVAGIRMHMVHVPSEAESELCVWLPDDRVLLSAEVIQTTAAPTSTRCAARSTGTRSSGTRASTSCGSGARPSTWCCSTGRRSRRRRGRRHPAQLPRRHPVPARPDPAVGQPGTGQGRDRPAGAPARAPRELVAVDAPFYGSVQHNVPAIYNGYLGWFDGDPVALDPTPAIRRAPRPAHGWTGRRAGRGPRAYGDHEWQFTAELTTTSSGSTSTTPRPGS
jgi:alkyl sulfatase BDS1-like metallo-beta-lactamase superfamily hydrolase